MTNGSTRFNAKKVAAAIEDDLRRVGTPERAKQEQAYLKSDLEFLGASVPEIRNATRKVKKEFPTLGHDDIVDLVNELWRKRLHERRMAAVEVLELYVQELGYDDLKWLENLLRESRTWALVDDLSGNVVGSIAQADPKAHNILDTWIDDPDFWIRRSALLAHLLPLRRPDGDPTKFFEYADRLLEEKEFFIRKAIGWVLRELGRRQPRVVSDWLAPRTDRVSGVTIREAVKYLDESDRENLMQAYREKRQLNS